MTTWTEIELEIVNVYLEENPGVMSTGHDAVAFLIKEKTGRNRSAAAVKKKIVEIKKLRRNNAAAANQISYQWTLE